MKEYGIEIPKDLSIALREQKIEGVEQQIESLELRANCLKAELEKLKSMNLSSQKG
jgi:cell division protein FtsB